MGSNCCKAKKAKEELANGNTSPNSSEEERKTAKEVSDEELIVPTIEDQLKPSPEALLPKLSETESKTGKKTQPIPKPRIKTPKIRKVTSSTTEFWSQAVNELAFDMLHQIVAKDHESNVAFSPLAISMALAMIESGADGETRKQIRQLFGQPIADGAKAVEMFGKLRSKVQPPKQFSGESSGLFDGNSFFYADNLKLKQDFTEAGRKWFKTQPAKAPFAKQTEAARSQINKWASDTTKGKIPEILKKGAVDNRTSCVVVSTMYLNMDWAEPFDPVRTETRPFYRCGTEEKQIARYMLRCGDRIPYASNTHLHLVELPYAWDALSMYFIVPKHRDEVGQVEQIEIEELISLFRSMSPSSVRLEIPKFTVHLPVKLMPVLQQLGMRDWKNLSRMTSDSHATISDIVHETYLKVQEKATEGSVQVPKPAKQRPKYVRPLALPSNRHISVFADHPFLFTIVHKPTWVILHMGKVNGVE